MSKEKSVPAIRVTGFNDKWEVRKLKDIAVFNPKNTLPTEFKYVDLESVVGTEMISYRQEKHDQAPSRAQRLAKKGDVFYQTVRPYQKNNYLFDLLDEDFVFSTGYAQLRPHGDSYFLLSRLQEESFVSNVLDRCTGTSYPAINSNDLSEMEIKIPSQKNEQKEIGVFFKYLDENIVLCQKDLTNLKNFKQAMLQKMFPKEGETVPEVRFEGFKEEWKTFALRNISKISTGYPFDSKTFEEDGKYLVTTNSNIQNDSPFVNNSIGNRINLDSSSNLDEYILNLGDILVTMDGTVGRTATVINQGLILAQRVGRIVANQNPKFLYQLLNAGHFSEIMAEISTGGTIKHISLNEIGDYPATIPPSNKEMELIGNYFFQLDQNIISNQAKLDKIKQFKQAMLDKMFV